LKTWKQWTFVAIFLLIGGTIFVNAQDMIIRKDGNMIEAKVVEISPSEIRYKRFDHLDGPTIVISTADVLSIRYENGTYEIINTVISTEQEKNQAENPNTTALNPDKFIFAFNANGGGAILAGVSLPGNGPSLCFEFSKGKFNTEINLIIPVGYSVGFGGLATFNYFWHSRIGGFYLGGGLGYIYSTYTEYGVDLYRVKPGTEGMAGNTEFIPASGSADFTNHNFTFGLNIGYKFVTKSGVYFRTGAYVGMAINSGTATSVNKDLGFLWEPDNPLTGQYNGISNEDHFFKPSVYFKPDLTIGYAFK
jgi:hypothetical protein